MRLLKRSVVVFMILIFVIFSGCSGDEYIQIYPGQTAQGDRYENAIIDAMVAEEDEIYDDLIAITEDNDYLIWQEDGQEKRVLVVTWTGYPDSFPDGNTVTTWWGEPWVTVVPEIRDWFGDNYAGETDMILRAEQLLGLPRDAAYTHFVELWVQPDDLFRPTPDNEITDRAAQLEFPESAQEWYIEWFNENIIYSYFPMRYPWTRLGYTYDWGNEDSEIGLSEFVIKKDSEVIVESVSLTGEYLAD